MTHHTLPTPITEDQVRALRVGDTVTLEETLYGIRDATQIGLVPQGGGGAGRTSTLPASVPAAATGSLPTSRV